MVERRHLLAALAGVPLAPGVAAAATLDGPPPPVADLAALRAWRGEATALCLLGHSQPGDGGGGVFVRSGAEAAAVDDGVTAVVDADRRLWRRLYSGPVDVRWAGARCDGRTDDAAAVHAAAAVGAIVFPVGDCRIAADLTLAAPVTVMAGARVSPARGCVVTFARGFEAPLETVFAGEGTVAFDPAHFTVGRPEWWGARTNQPGFDCSPAINACIAACPETHLAAADYHIAAPVKIMRSARVLLGVAANQANTSFGTRLVIDDAVCDGLQVGPDSQPPGGFDGWPQRMRVSSLTVIRAVRVTPKAAGFDGPSGVRVQYALTCYLDDINSMESINGFYIRGVVHSYLRSCQALRQYAGTRRDNDYFHGFHQDGSPSIGANTGIASLYYQNCSVFAAEDLSVSESSGIYTQDGMTDTFITALETAHLDHGLNLNGRGAEDQADSAEDLIVEACVLDSCKKSGVLLNAGNARTAVTIHNCYIAATGAGNGVTVQCTHGAVSITGCQIISGPGGTTAGLLVTEASGVTAQGNIYTDCFHPVLIERSSHCQLRDIINNPRVATGFGAVWLRSGSRVVIACVVKGAAGVHPAGVCLTTDREAGGQPCGFNAIDASGIDPACLARGAGAKIVHEGAAVAAAGAFGRDNLAHGIMG